MMNDVLRAERSKGRQNWGDALGVLEYRVKGDRSCCHIGSKWHWQQWAARSIYAHGMFAAHSELQPVRFERLAPQSQAAPPHTALN
jgi:hypothetical protein